MFPSLAAVLCSAALLAAQAPTGAEPLVRVPTFPNSTCPIMGKKVSMPLFVDTDVGRFYLCCKPCVRKVLADVPTAHKTAYPVVDEVDNKVCPVSGEPIGEHAVRMTLQGSRFALCCAGCTTTAQKHTQVTLTRLHEPKLLALGNQTCPVSAKPTTPNAFAVIDDVIVQLADAALISAVEKAPAAMLAKARKITAQQPAPAPHRHVERSKGDASGSTQEPAEKRGEKPPEEGGTEKGQ